MSMNTYIKKLFRLGFSIDDVVHNVKVSFGVNVDDARSHVTSMYREFKHEMIQDMLLMHKIYKFKDIRFLLKDCYIIDDSSDAELKKALKDLG